MAVDQNWRYDGTALQTLAFNIQTFGGRMRMAAVRGGNVRVPYRHGTLWTPKYYDENELDLAMWVLGADPTTGEPDADPQAKMWEHVQTLQRLFSDPSELHTLTKRHPVEDVDVAAIAEVQDVMDFRSQAGATRAGFIPSLVLPEVWFKEIVYSDDGGLLSRATAATWPVVVGGDVATTDILITLKATTGTPSNIQIQNTTIDPTTAWVKLLDVMATGEEVVIDVAKWTATLDGVTNVVNNVDWSGQPEFFRLLPGSNTMKITVTGGPVDVKMEWKGRYW